MTKNCPLHIYNSRAGYVKAFTIMEVVVAMLLATISIAISYSAYKLIGLSYGRFDQKNKTIAELTVADKLLKQDVLQSEKILRLSDGLSFQFSEETVDYYFGDNIVIRDQFRLRRDTISLKVTQFLTTFENEECLPGSLVDEIKLDVEIDQRQVPFVYKKNYSAEELFEQKAN